MCLQTDWVEPKVAEEDMTVYKRLIVREGTDGEFHMYGPFYRLEYVKGQLYSTTMKKVNNWEHGGYDEQSTVALNEYRNNKDEGEAHYITIADGFHSALNPERLGEEGYGDFIYECTIPKGSSYYIGFSDLVVSNQIIIKKQVT